MTKEKFYLAQRMMADHLNELFNALKLCDDPWDITYFQHLIDDTLLTVSGLNDIYWKGDNKDESITCEKKT